MLSSVFSEWLRLSATNILADACIKASVFLALTAIAAFVLRRSSAAVRHRLWCLGFCGLVVLPLLSLTLPQWRIPVLPAPEVAMTEESIDEVSVAEPIVDLSDEILRVDGSAENRLEPVGHNDSFDEQRAPEFVVAPVAHEHEAASNELTDQNAIDTPPTRNNATSGPNWLLGLWLVGIAIVLFPFALGIGANSIMLWRSRRIPTSKWSGLIDELAARLGLTRRVIVLESQDSVVPMTWGVVRPVVLLPSESHEWNEDRRRIVLLHELAHVKRLDVLFQSIARFACALYWFNPLAWYALWRLRVERELACDDCVVAAGERPSDYATQLLQIATTYRPARFSVGVAMARSTKLEDRIVAMLDRARSHLPVGKQLARMLLAGTCAIVLGLSVVGLGERTITSAEEDKNKAIDENSQDTTTTKIVRGIVVDESGEPIAGAEILTVLNSRERMTWVRQNQVLAKTKSDRDGSFEIEVPRHDDATLGNQYRNIHEISLLATASGFGPDAIDEIDKVNLTDKIELKLVKDSVPLEGRVLDLEGRPVAGVQLRVRSITTTTANLDTWIARAMKNPKSLPKNTQKANQLRSEMAYFPYEKVIEVDGLPMFPTVRTDASGRFRIRGLGPDRYISLEVEGESIAKEWVSAITRKMPTVPLPAGDPRIRTDRCFGTKFDYTAEPMQAITGIVRDQDSQAPIAGVVVGVEQFGGSLLSVPKFVSDATDAQGRYRLVGLPKQPDGARPIRLMVSPNSDQPYFRTEATVAGNAEGLDPVSFDIELKQAVWLSGRMIDQRTNEPLVGYVSYFPFIDNSVAADYANFDSGLSSVGHDDWYRTADDGSYRIPAIRGRGVIVAKAAAAPDYRIAHGAAKIGWKSERRARDRIVYHLHGPEVANSVREVDIAGDEATEQDIALVPLSRQQVRMIDRDGQPLSNVRVAGWRPNSALNATDEFHRAKPRKGSTVDLLGLAMDGQRLVLFSQDDRKLGTVIVADKTTESVTLEPHATFTGRLVDAKGSPIEGHHVSAAIPQSESPEPNDKRGWGRRKHYLVGATTDETGRFRFDNVLPGARYEIYVNNRTVAMHDTVGAGEVIDFGDLKVTTANDDDQANAKVIPNGKVIATNDSVSKELDGEKAATFVLAGRVLNPNGKPQPKAKLYFAPYQGATKNDLQVRDVADTDGRFSFSVPVTELNRLTEGLKAPWSHPRVTARFKGFGPDWQYVVKPDANKDVTLRLVKDDVPIQGRIVTIEGSPVPNATIYVLRVKASPEEKLEGWLKELGNAGEFWSEHTFELTKSVHQNAAGLPARVTTDQQGRFKLFGIGRDRVVDLRVEGPTIETRRFSVMTAAHDAVRVPFDKEEPEHGTFVCYSANFSHPAAPSRPVEGKIVDATSGKPIAGVTVFCYKRAGHPVHGRYRPEVVSDANGKFALRGLPKGRDNKIQFMPANDQPYLPFVREFDTSDGLEPLLADVTMQRGALIRGRVTDQATGNPVVGARVEYFSLRNENAATHSGFTNNDDITTTTDADGNYQIVGLPGRGLIAVRAKSNKFAAGRAIDTVEEDSRPIGGGLHRGFNTSPSICLASQHHSVAVVEAKIDITNNRDVQLECGRELTVKLVGPGEQPLTGVEVNRRGLEACQWRGGEITLESPEFTVRGLTADMPRMLILRHRSKGLAAAQLVQHDSKDDTITIRLEPAGEIAGRLLDQGKPAAFVEFRGSLTNSETLQNDWLRVRSDETGRFSIEGLVPGKSYRLRTLRRTESGYALLSRESTEPVDLIAKSGTTLDLGDVLVE